MIILTIFSIITALAFDNGVLLVPKCMQKNGLSQIFLGVCASCLVSAACTNRLQWTGTCLGTIFVLPLGWFGVLAASANYDDYTNLCSHLNVRLLLSCADVGNVFTVHATIYQLCAANEARMVSKGCSQMLQWRLGWGLAAFCGEIIFQSNSLWDGGWPHFPEWLSTLFVRKRGQAQKLIYQNYPEQNWPTEATDAPLQSHTKQSHVKFETH